MEFNQVTLPSRDVARGAAFYRRLGLVQIVENLPLVLRGREPAESAVAPACRGKG